MKGNFQRRLGREGRRLRRTSSILHVPDTERGNACPIDCAVCGKQQDSLCRYTSPVRAVCVNAHVRICAGGAEQSASLPRQLNALASIPAGYFSDNTVSRPLTFVVL